MYRIETALSWLKRAHRRRRVTREDGAKQGHFPVGQQRRTRTLEENQEACAVPNNVVRLPRWSPYVVGAAIGVLSWVTFAWMHQALGTSTSYVHAAAGVEKALVPAHVAGNEYFVKALGTPESPKPLITWQVALVVMLGVGAFVAARLGRSSHVEHVPALWAWRFGGSRLLRYAAAFAGGALLIFGARLADGCTSGHGISGGLQLALSSWIFLVAMFAAGIAAAMLMFGSEGRRHV
jgi:hypothetical protein